MKMSSAAILMKGNEFTHTYSNNVVKKLKKEGWKVVIRISGWNMSFSYGGYK